MMEKMRVIYTDNNATTKVADEVLEEIEKEVKKKKLFALERKITVTKSGNSLVVRIPPEIAKFSKLHYQSILRLVPVTKKRIELEILA